MILKDTIALSNKEVLVVIFIIFYNDLVMSRKTKSSHIGRGNRSRMKNENSKLIVEANDED